MAYIPLLGISLKRNKTCLQEDLTANVDSIIPNNPRMETIKMFFTWWLA